MLQKRFSFTSYVVTITTAIVAAVHKTEQQVNKRFRQQMIEKIQLRQTFRVV